jgi:hypothetical protein
MADKSHTDNTKSGIEGPGGYNFGHRPSSIAAPVKHYPGSGSIGKGHTSGGGKTIEGPASCPVKNGVTEDEGRKV